VDGKRERGAHGRRAAAALVALVAASVCLIGPARASEADRSERTLAVGAPAFERAPTVNCATPLKLHDGTHQSGATAQVSVRGVWVNLSSLGFDNRTSSFTVGSCAVELASAANGGGAWYLRCLSPGCVENTMDLGWNNVISSVYLH
jgi:hypothetical protein